MAGPELRTGIPIWVRVPAIIVLVLLVVALGPVFLDAAGVGSGHGAGSDIDMDSGDHDSPQELHRPAGGDPELDDGHGSRNDGRGDTGH